MAICKELGCENEANHYGRCGPCQGKLIAAGKRAKKEKEPWQKYFEKAGIEPPEDIAPEAAPERRLVLNFEGEPEIWAKLKKAASVNKRTPEAQVMFMLWVAYVWDGESQDELYKTD